MRTQTVIVQFISNISTVGVLLTTIPPVIQISTFNILLFNNIQYTFIIGHFVSERKWSNRAAITVSTTRSQIPHPNVSTIC